MTVPFAKSVICPVLIGRAPHLETITKLLDHARQSRSQTLLISGEAGLGKSRLLAEVKSHPAVRGWQVLQGYCFETDRGLPYAPIVDMLRSFAAGQSGPELVEIFGPAAAELGPLLPELAARLPTRPAAEPDRHRLFFALAQFCIGLTAGRPLLLLIEDLHWSDESSFDLLLYLIRHLAARPVLFVFTFRSDETGPELTHFLAQLDRSRMAVEVSLSPFNREQVERMVQAIFEQPRPIRAEFLETLVTLTEGNPFFIEETLKSMLMAGDIFFAEDGIWDRKSLPDLQIPRSIHDAVQRRSRQLSPQAGHLLNLAAVAGRRFDFGLLQRLTHMDDASLLDCLKELMAAQLVVEDSADVFSFRHALTRAAVYATLLARERRQYHRDIGQILEQRSAARLADLADHFYQGEVWDKALEYSQRAGEKAQSLYAPQAALAHFNHAIEAAQRLEQPPQAQLLYRRGLAYATLNNFEAARADYQLALDLACAQTDRLTEWQVLLALGNLWTARDFAKPGDYFRQAHDLARTLADPALIARSLNSIGNWHMNQDQPFAALRDHREALAVFQTISDPAGIAQTLDLLAITSFNCGDLLSGRRYYREALPLWRQLDDRQGLLHTLSGIGLAVDFEFEFDDAPVAECLPWAEQAVQVSRDIGWRSGESLSLVTLGLVLYQGGQYGPALEALNHALALAEEIEHHGWTADALRALGAVYLDILALPQAQQHLERALNLAYEINSWIWIHQSAWTLAIVYAAQNELEQARRLLDKTLPADTPMQALQPRFLWGSRIELTLAEGNFAEALRLADRLIAGTANLSPGDGRVVPRVWQLRGRALAGLRRFTEAEAVFRAALATASAQGRRGRQWRLHRELAGVYLAQGRSEAAADELAAAGDVIRAVADTFGEFDSLRDDFLRQALASLPTAPPLSPQQQAKLEFAGLTRREREVAALVAQGKTNRDIADELILSERTAERHIANIMSKLGFNSRAQIAAWAVAKGLIAS